MGKNKNESTTFKAEHKVIKIEVEADFDYESGERALNGGADLWVNNNDVLVTLNPKEVKELYKVLGNIIDASKVVSK